MKPIRFRTQAARDLRDIIQYYHAYSPQTVQKMLDDIYRSIDLLTFSPSWADR